jgi:hypothetical protein
MDPRRIELTRRQSIEMNVLLAEFLGVRPGLEAMYEGFEMTEEQDAAWTAYSADLLRRHQAERSALADEIKAERRQQGTS